MKKLLVALILLIASICYADITGYDSETGIITGSGFGTKTTAAPIKWMNFDSGSDGVVIAGSNTPGDCEDCWTDYAARTDEGSVAPKYSNTNLRASDNNLLNGKFEYGSVTVEFSDSILIWEGSEELTDKVFVSFWIRHSWGSSADTAYQFKIFAVKKGEPDWLTSYPNIFWSSTINTAGNNSYNLSYYPNSSSNLNPTGLKDIGAYNYNPMGVEVWSYIEVWFEGDPTNGEIHIKKMNPTGDSIVQKDFTGRTLDVGAENYWKNFHFGRTFANVSDPATLDAIIHYDDIYIDKSWARVFFGDESTHSACSYFEMQPPVTWSDTEIATEVNWGQLPDTAYAYIRDSNGDLISENGFEITLGEGVGSSGTTTLGQGTTTLGPGTTNLGD